MLKSIHFFIGLVLVQCALSVDDSLIVSRFNACEELVPAIEKAQNSIKLAQAAKSASSTSSDCGLSLDISSVHCNVVNFYNWLASVHSTSSSSNTLSSTSSNATSSCGGQVTIYNVNCYIAYMKEWICGTDATVSAVHSQALTHTKAVADTFNQCIFKST